MRNALVLAGLGVGDALDFRANLGKIVKQFVFIRSTAIEFLLFQVANQKQQQKKNLVYEEIRPTLRRLLQDQHSKVLNNAMTSFVKINGQNNAAASNKPNRNLNQLQNQRSTRHNAGAARQKISPCIVRSRIETQT